MKLLNSKKIHFSASMSEKVVLLNQSIGKCIAEEFKDFKDLEERESERISEMYIMQMCCQHSAVLGEFNKIMFPPLLSSGFVFKEFIANKGLEYVAHLMKWLIETIRQIEEKNGGKNEIKVMLC